MTIISCFAEYLHRQFPLLTALVAVLILLVMKFPGLFDRSAFSGGRLRDSSQLADKFWWALGVTLPTLGCALYVIASPTYGDAEKQWAYGAVGTLLGFWLGAW
jgi:hypothetical protein